VQKWCKPVTPEGTLVAHSTSRTTSRFRVGSVTVYAHHGAWWLYYRQGGKNVRRRVAETRGEAEQVAARINAQLAENAPTLLTFAPMGIAELQSQFLDYHESILQSSVNTVSRYRSATQHLINFAESLPRVPQVHELNPEAFLSYLRKIEVAPNGHHNSAKRRLRSKGILYILETCRSMYHFALKRRSLPPYSNNLFSELPMDRFKLEDSKPIFVFTAETELAFLKVALGWEWPIHFTLAKTGLRVGELTHLLIEDLDLMNGWLHVRNKLELGWRIKTGHERKVPLIPELVSVLQRVIGERTAGVVFLRELISKKLNVLSGGRREMEDELQVRLAAKDRPLPRAEVAKVARSVWLDAGMVKADAIRTSFIRLMKKIGHPESTCPKSWRHTFATLLQDANVDPLIRQQVMGHRPTNSNGLGMTANYTHTRVVAHVG
jgi:integrase